MSCVAILVNYHTADLLISAVQSLVDCGVCDEIMVVDNSESTLEAAQLRANLPAFCRLLVPDKNLGFGQACNFAYASTNAEYILLLNPDARLLTGSLARMVSTLRENSQLGAVGPRVFWDENCQFFLPPSTFPSRWNHLRDQVAGRSRWINSWRSARFRSYALRYWQSDQTMAVGALSGGVVLLRRSAVEMAGGLFDPAFFMYWEDSDLICRLKSAGFLMCMNPHASAVHLYEHSPAKDEMISKGWPVYAKKHFSGWPWRLMGWALNRCEAINSSTSNFVVVNQLPMVDLVIDVPKELAVSWLLEFSPCQDFVPSIGHFGRGSRAVVPHVLTSRFTGRDYYLRIGSMESSGSCFVVRGGV